MLKFSIIIPVYNVEMYLRDCVESVINQTFRDFELVLVDDGSTDMSAEICDEYSSLDDRIQVIHKKNGGLSSARNAGLDVARGEYILFIDSDDGFSGNDVLYDIVNKIEEWNGPDVIVTETNVNWELCTGEQALLLILKEWQRSKKIDIVVWDKIYRRDFLVSNSIKFVEGFVHEDLYWTLAVLERAKTCVQTGRFYFHREVSTSITRAKSEYAILNRAVSKLNIAEISVTYFENKNIGVELKQLIFEFYIGIYLSGLLEGEGLNDAELKKRFTDVLTKTDKIFRVANSVKRKKYKFLGRLYKMFGINAIRFLVNVVYRK